MSYELQEQWVHIMWKRVAVIYILRGFVFQTCIRSGYNKFVYIVCWELQRPTSYISAYNFFWNKKVLFKRTKDELFGWLKPYLAGTNQILFDFVLHLLCREPIKKNWSKYLLGVSFLKRQICKKGYLCIEGCLFLSLVFEMSRFFSAFW